MRTAEAERELVRGLDPVRFWAKVEKTATCWTWTGSIGSRGYGVVYYDRDPVHERLMAHRVAKILAGEIIPDGLQLDHLCRVRHCVNPAHTEAVTLKENIMRGFWRGAVNARKTHCQHGHPLAGQNLIVRADLKRACRKCKQILGRRTAQRRRLRARQGQAVVDAVFAMIGGKP